MGVVKDFGYQVPTNNICKRTDIDFGPAAV